MTLTVRLHYRQGDFVLETAFVAPSGVTVLFGPSGSGKTTIANALAGLVTPDHGHIECGGRVLFDSEAGIDLAPHKRRIGYVFQEDRLFPHMTVHQNLTYGLRFSRGRKQDFERIVSMLGLAHLLERRPAHLSGGEKQRVAIGRALLPDPDLIIADEPLASLDEARRNEILPYFETLRDDVSIPIFYVSHSASEVARLATTVIIVENGRVTRFGDAVDVLADPAVAPRGVRFVGAVIAGQIVTHHDDGLTEIDAGGVRMFVPRLAQNPGSRVRLRIEAQDVILSRERATGLSALNMIAGTVETIRHGDGPGSMVSLATPAGRILARVTKRSVAALDLEQGVTCHAILKTLAIAPDNIGTGPFDEGVR